MSLTYLTLPEAASRSGRSIGHLRRLCQDKYAPAGTAEMRRAGRTTPVLFLTAKDAVRWPVPEDFVAVLEIEWEWLRGGEGVMAQALVEGGAR